MSRITKSDLLEQNRQLWNVMVQIHRMTAPFVDSMANQAYHQNEDNQPIETSKKSKIGSTAQKTKSAANENRSKSNSPMPEPTANRNAIKRPLRTSVATENANSSTNTSPSSKTDGDDEFLGYLKLQKVSQPANNLMTRSANQSKRKSASPVSDESGLHILKIPRVILNRLSPEEIIRARQRQSVQLKMLNRHAVTEERRRMPYRKAAPINLIEAILD